jgi:peptidoglycan-associated lipoprotein
MRPILSALLVLAACHHDKQAKTTPVPPASAPTATAPQPEKQTTAQQVPISSNLDVSADLVKLCKLKYQSEQQAAPKFDFDRFELTAQDRAVLEQIAGCITSGPLKGRRLQLIGRADPRGTDEYNMGLGDRRAHSVGTYLERLGVATSAIDATTRGSTDATGHDEATWAIDRRVDLDVM